MSGRAWGYDRCSKRTIQTPTPGRPISQRAVSSRANHASGRYSHQLWKHQNVSPQCPSKRFIYKALYCSSALEVAADMCAGPRPLLSEEVRCGLRALAYFSYPHVSGVADAPEASRSLTSLEARGALFDEG